MIITECRICANSELISILDLGSLAITGVFPHDRDAQVPAVPLDLVRCGPGGCGLVQLRHTTDVGLMYGTGSYGYRSNIRPFMINHLGQQVEKIVKRIDLGPGDLVLDIGSNDSTLLQAYSQDGLTLVGIDPNGEQFRSEYPARIDLISDYFSRDRFTAAYGRRKAKVVTSIAMFYDLARPLEVMQDIYDVLDDDGIWVSEQSYLPSMLAEKAYDVVCHEHLEYYALHQFEWMAERVGFTIIDAEITPVYGGSLNVTMAKNPRRAASHNVAVLRDREVDLGLQTPAPFEAFASAAVEQRAALRQFLDDSRAAGKVTLGYGASTKGNVVLQYCGVTTADLPCIGEVNKGKSGCYTPGTRIPIVSEEEALSMRPDQLLVLPWIYRDDFIDRERQYLADGGKLVFPLPVLDVVSGT